MVEGMLVRIFLKENQRLRSEKFSFLLVKEVSENTLVEVCDFGRYVS